MEESRSSQSPSKQKKEKKKKEKKEKKEKKKKESTRREAQFIYEPSSNDNGESYHEQCEIIQPSKTNRATTGEHTFFI